MARLEQDAQRARRRFGFRRRAFFIAAITAGVVGVLAVFGAQSVQRIKAVEQRWIAYNQDAITAGNLLYDLSRKMGYGGFIHNIKNFILRRDSAYLVSLEDTRKQMDADLDKLAGLVINAQEKEALAEIRKTLKLYGDSVKTAMDGFRRGLSSVDVDILVRVDDTRALKAIEVLNQSFSARTQRGEREITMAVQAAVNLVWMLLAVVPVIILIGGVLIVFLRRMMDANSRLAEVRDELTILLRQAPDAILQIDRNGRILRANDRAVQLFGYRHKDLLNLRIETLFPARLRKTYINIFYKTFHAPQTGVQARAPVSVKTLCALTRTGKEIPVEVSLNFLRSGERRIATAIVRDVSERKRTERVLKQAHDELEQRVRERTRELEDEINERHRAQTQLVQAAKMATIGEMASGITHELNQPMTVMRMGVEAAQMQIERGKGDIPSLSKTLARIENQIVRMTEIIEHMRAFSYQDTSGQSLFSPYQAVREGCHMFLGQLRDVHVDLVVAVPQSGDDMGCVLGHAVRLEQVVLNLLSNARDAILTRKTLDGNRNQKGERAGRIEVRMWEDKRTATIHLSIEDNGGGIAPDILARIFDPFTTTKGRGVGTGLGLSISHGIIENMGGSIAAVNAKDGARFEIVLPRTIGTGGAGGVLDLKPKAQQPLKILVVNGDRSAAHRLGDYLQNMGHLISIAYTADEATRVYESDPVRAVVIGAQVPLADCRALASQLCRQVIGLPIFVMRDDGVFDAAFDGVTQVWRTSISLDEVAERLVAAVAAL